MKIIQVFDPAMCCSSGVCGGEGDQALVSFSAEVNWAKKNGVQIERFNLSSEPLKFVENKTVSSFLERSGADSLPLILIDGEITLAGRYPNRAELIRWAGITPEIAEIEATSNCCSGSKCC